MFENNISALYKKLKWLKWIIQVLIVTLFGLPLIWLYFFIFLFKASAHSQIFYRITTSDTIIGNMMIWIFALIIMWVILWVREKIFWKAWDKKISKLNLILMVISIPVILIVTYKLIKLQLTEDEFMGWSSLLSLPILISTFIK